MEKNIEVDLSNDEDLLEKYNENKISKEMLEYIIEQAMFINKNQKIKIIINKKYETNRNITKMIKDGLKDEYNMGIRERHDNNMKQLWLLVLGIIFLFLSTLIEEDVIWKELLLIIAWVPIWEMIEVELFPDLEGRKRRKIIKKLLNSKIEEKIYEMNYLDINNKEQV